MGTDWGFIAFSCFIGLSLAAIVFLFVHMTVTDERAKKLFRTRSAAVNMSRIGNEFEIETKSGEIWRSEQGILWYKFPSGYRAPLDLENALERELKRLQRVAAWTEDT